MEISRSTLHYDVPIGTLTAQAGVDCTVPLPAGMTCASVLDAGASAGVSGCAFSERGADITGVLTFRPLVLDAQGAPVPFTATADFSHRIEREGLSADMRASAVAEVLSCTCKPLGDAVRMRATVQLRIFVISPVEAGAVACLTPAPGLEQLTTPLTTGQRMRIGSAKLQLHEQISLPHGFTVHRATGVPLVRDASPADGGAVCDGTLNLTLLGTAADGGLTEHPCSLAFSGAVPLENAEQVAVAAELLSLSVVREDEEDTSAAADAVIVLTAYGTLTQETPVLLDAYDPTQAFVCERQTAVCLLYCGTVERREHAREQLRVPEGMPDAYMPVHVRATPAVTGQTHDSVDGVLHVTVVYRCDEGMYHSFTEPVPFSVPVPADRAALACPRVTVAAVQATGSGRTFDVQITLTVSGVLCREEEIAYTTGISPGAAAEKPTGVLLYFPDTGETLFSVGKRFSVPTADIRRMNPDVPDPLPDGARLVLLR